MYQALYRSFRPETFDGVMGQEHIVRILKNQIAEGTVGHAYLFCGTRGTGKTTMARILAKGVNCSESDGEKPCGTCAMCLAIKDGICMDVIEIDAASNNGVDNIRELRESVNYPPVMGRRKVYIIDEVHMLTLPAFNALLKTLEEPPENIMFILATTEPHKLPATILSRCLRLDFRRVPEKQLIEGLRNISEKVGVNISDSALALIATNADGSVRDSLSLLDQCISAGSKDVSREDVLELLGTGGEEVFVELTDMVENRDITGILLLLDRILADGKDVRRIIKDWVSHYRNLMIAKFVQKPEDLLAMSVENIERIREQSRKLDLASISDAIMALSETLSDAKWSTQPRILLELCAIRMAGEGDLQRAGERSAQSVRKSSLPAGPKAGDTAKAQRKTEPEAPAQQKTEPEAPAQQKTEPEAKVQRKTEPEAPTQRKTEPEAPAQQKTEPEVAAAADDLAGIWNQALLALKDDQGRYTMLKNGSRPDRVEGSCFYVQVKNEIALRFVQDSANLLIKSISAQTGQKYSIECTVGNEDNGREERAGIDPGTIQKMGDFFGTSIEVK